MRRRGCNAPSRCAAQRRARAERPRTPPAVAPFPPGGRREFEASTKAGTIGDEYSLIDFNNAVPTAFGYNGDFNRDGAITGGDYLADRPRYLCRRARRAKPSKAADE